MVSVKMHVRISLFALLLYVAIHTKQVVYANTETDCSSDLNIENERYILTGNVASGGCVIAANGVIIDGQGLYTINGGITSEHDVNNNAFDFTLQNLTLTQNILANGDEASGGVGGGDGSSITVIDSQLQLGDYGGIFVRGGDGDDTHAPGDGGSVTITNSDLSGYEARIEVDSGNTTSDSPADGGRAGNVTMTDSDSPQIKIYSFSSTSYNGNAADGGVITVTDSTIREARSIGGENHDGGNGGSGGEITIIRSSATMLRSNGGDADLIAGNGGDISITDSTISTVESYGGSGNVTNGEAGELTLVNNAPTLTINPVSETINMSNVYDPLTGITVEDALDGDLTDDVEVSGSVGASAGRYTLTYSVTDEGMDTVFNSGPVTADPETTIGTRTVTREEAAQRKRGGRKITPIQTNAVLLQDQLAQLLLAYKQATGSDFFEIPAKQNEFPRDLEFGMSGEDVNKLQTFLVERNTGPAAAALAQHGITHLFGSLTRDAVIEYQIAHGITPAVGFFGPVTRAYVSTHEGL